MSTRRQHYLWYTPTQARELGCKWVNNKARTNGTRPKLDPHEVPQKVPPGCPHDAHEDPKIRITMDLLQLLLHNPMAVLMFSRIWPHNTESFAILSFAYFKWEFASVSKFDVFDYLSIALCIIYYVYSFWIDRIPSASIVQCCWVSSSSSSKSFRSKDNP